MEHRKFVSNNHLRRRYRQALLMAMLTLLSPLFMPGWSQITGGTQTIEASTRPVNLIDNAGFEMGTEAPFLSGAVRGSLNLTSHPNQVYSGAYALKHTSDEANGYTLPWNGSNRITHSDDTTYEFSAWVKGQTPDSRVRIYLFSLQNNQTSAPFWTGKNFTVGTEWTQIKISHYNPPGYDQVAIRLDNRDAGNSVYWDDLDLISVPNLAHNEGFEKPRLPFGGAHNGQISATTDEFHKGNQSLLHIAEAADSFTTPYEGKGAGISRVNAGNTYTFSAWAKGEGNTPVQLRIFALDDKNRSIGNQVGTFTAKTNWKNFSIEYTVPAGTKNISIRLDNDGGPQAKIWWDDLILRQKIVDTEPQISFTTPVTRSLHAGETVFLDNIHQSGQEGWFSFEIPGNAVNLQWIQTQGPVDISLSAPRAVANGFAFSGVAQFVDSRSNREAPKPRQDFTAELQFEVDGQPLSFFVQGNFKFVSWDMRIRGFDGFGFDITLSDFPTDHFFDLEITNFSFDEDLIIPIFDLFETVHQSPFGIDTSFVVNGVQDPDGIDPFGVVLVPPGGVETIPIRLIASFGAESGDYDATFEGRARNGNTETARLFGMFRRSGDDLSIDNISVSVFAGPSIPNRGTYTITEPLQSSGQSVTFEIQNFNNAPVLLEEPAIGTISAPEGSNLQFVQSGPISGILGNNGEIVGLSGTLNYDEATTSDGNFAIDVSFFVLDEGGGFEFSDVYSFTIRGAIGSGNPCAGEAKRGDPACEGTLLFRFVDDVAITPEGPNPVGGIRGEYFDEDNIDVEIKVKNISDETCVVTGASATGDGYSIASNLPFPMTLEPEEERSFDVRFQFRGRPAGPHDGIITVNHDAGTNPIFPLTTDILPNLGVRVCDDEGGDIKLSLSPGETRGEFNLTPDGPRPTDVFSPPKLLSVKNTGTRPVVFKASQVFIDQDDIQGDEPFDFLFSGDDPTIQPGASSTFAVRLNTYPENPDFVGVFEGTISLPFEVNGGEPDSEMLYLKLFGDVGTPAILEVEACATGVICFAGAIVLTFDNPGEVGFSPSKSDYTFDLNNKGDKPIVIDTIDVSGAGFTVIAPTQNFGTPLSTWPQKFFRIVYEPPPGSDDGDVFNGVCSINFDPNTNPGMGNFIFNVSGQGGDVEVENEERLVPQAGRIEFDNNAQAPGGSVREEVIVQNFGNANLTGTAALTHLQGNGFSLSPGGTLLNLNVPPNGQQAFEVVLDRSNSGTFVAQVSVNHNRPGPDPYVFTVSGVIGGGPGGSGNLRVTHGATPVNHNSTFPFGQTPTGVPVGKNFRIYNEGNVPLVLPRANFTVPAGYQLIETPDGPIPPPDGSGTVFWDNFSVRLKADNPGQFNGTIRFSNTSGHSPNPFNINVEGSVGNQEPGPNGIRVTHGPTEVPHLSLFPFGSTQQGTFIGKNFRIWNETDEPLTFPRSSFSVPPGYQLIETPDGPIPPPDANGTVHWDNFSIHLAANNSGTFNGQVSFVPVRPNGNPLATYRMNVTGQVEGDPICQSDNTAPNLTITNPSANAVFEPGIVSIQATASDAGSGMERVKFFVNNNLVGNDTSPPYSAQWNAPIGNHTIKVQAFDQCGNLRVRTIGVTVEDPCSGDTQGPAVGITNPSNGAQLDPGLYNITVSASDPSGVERVEFYVNGSLKRNDTELPWTHGHWFTIAGQQTVSVIAYDNCGNSTADTITFTISENGAPCDGDNILPWGNITAPIQNAVLNPGTFTLKANASDNVNVAFVAFEIDGQVPANAVDFTPPYEFNWNATPGNHSVRIRIQDVCDNLGYSDSVSFSVSGGDPCATDNQAPSVAITVPQNGAQVEPGLIDITVNATDNPGGSGMDRVEFYINGSLISTDTAPPWTQGYWFTIEGQQTIQAIAYDQCDNSTSQSVTFEVTSSGAPCDGDTQPPTGAVTNPAPNSVIMPGPITLRGTATDNVSVLAVSFAIDGVVPDGNADLSPPYEYTWNATPGVHTIHMNMMDVCDNTGPSPTITVTVLGSEPTTVPNFRGEINGNAINGLIVNQTNPTIDFTWDHASAAPGIERYHIVVQPTGGPWLYGPNILYPNTSHSLQTSDLMPGTSYSIHIRAKSNDGIWGNFVNGGTFTVQ